MTNLPGGMRRKTFVEDSDDDDYQMAPGINSSQVKRNQISVMTIDDFVRQAEESSSSQGTDVDGVSNNSDPKKAVIDFCIKHKLFLRAIDEDEDADQDELEQAYGTLLEDVGMYHFDKITEINGDLGYNEDSILDKIEFINLLPNHCKLELIDKARQDFEETV